MEIIKVEDRNQIIFEIEKISRPFFFFYKIVKSEKKQWYIRCKFGLVLTLRIHLKELLRSNTFWPVNHSKIQLPFKQIEPINVKKVVLNFAQSSVFISMIYARTCISIYLTIKASYFIVCLNSNINYNKTLYEFDS